MAAFDEGLSAFDGGACDFDVLAGFGGGEAAAGDHVAVAEDGEVEGESDEGCGASGGHGLDGHDGLLGGADELVDGLDLDLHEEAEAVEDLDVGLDVVAVEVAVGDEFGHMCGESGDESLVSDHGEVVGESWDLPEVLVDELFGGGVVDEAEG